MKDRPPKKKRFIRFLMKRGVFQKFVKNRKHEIAEEFKKNRCTQDVFNQDDPYLMMYGFSWQNTDEGYDFWHKLNHDWLELVDELIDY